MKALLCLSLILLIACTPGKNSRESASPAQKEVRKRGPRIIVYKTKKDYYRQVPVQMSEDKSTIVSFPYPGDLMINGKLALPTSLSGGYCLDNKGINRNVAFLQITYEEYSQWMEPPAPEQLMMRILDKDPLLEMWDCGIKDTEMTQAMISSLNDVILSGKMNSAWTRIK